MYMNNLRHVNIYVDNYVQINLMNEKAIKRSFSCDFCSKINSVQALTMDKGGITLGWRGYDGESHNWCLIDQNHPQSSFVAVNSEVNQPLYCNFTGYL